MENKALNPDSIDDADFINNVNRHGWNQLNKVNCPYTRPVLDEDYKNAKNILDPSNIIPWNDVRKILCLAAGGGQQGPLFSHLGYDVTVLDLSDEQLNNDAKIAKEKNLKIRCVQGDALSFSEILAEKFDLIYQPVSTLYMQDLDKLFLGVVESLTENGCYYGEHWNGIWQQLPDGPCWNGHSYEIMRSALNKEPVAQTNWIIDGKRIISDPVLVFAHSPVDILSAMCRSRLNVSYIEMGYLNCGADETADPNSLEHLSAYFPPVLRVLAK